MRTGCQTPGSTGFRLDAQFVWVSDTCAPLRYSQPDFRNLQYNTEHTDTMTPRVTG